MGGKNWQRLHRLIYLAGFAAIVHYWWMVKPGVTTPWKVTAVLYRVAVRPVRVLGDEEMEEQSATCLP